MLPTDTIFEILSYYDLTDLRNMRVVNHEFNEHIIKIIGDRYKSHVHKSWLPMISREASQTYFGYIARKFDLSMDLIFKCLLTPLDSIRVVIVGDKPNRFSDGYAFSAKDGFSSYSSSIGRIIEEVVRDIGIKKPVSLSLEKWAGRGVLLLNRQLTVLENWEQFTNKVLQIVACHHEHIVFMLWGRYAGDTKELITGDHLILTAPHPSPMVVTGKFAGCGHFSKANAYLESHGLETIDWSL